MKKKYGIYLAYAPEQEIRNQGLGRLLAFIIKGAIENNTALVLAYPKWYEGEIKALCKDQGIDEGKIEFIMTDGIPFLIRIKSFIDSYKKRKKKKSNFFKKLLFSLGINIGKIGIQWLGITNPIFFLLVSVIILSLLLLLSPLLVFIGITYIIVKFSKKIISKLLNKSISFMKLEIIFTSLQGLKNNIFIHSIYDKILKQELTRLSKKINKREDISAWLIPTLFWPDVEMIKAKKVIVAPDIILYDFPAQYNTPIFQLTNNKIQKTLTVSDHLITYSQYVKENHLKVPFGIEDAKISVIHHGASDLSRDLIDEDSLTILQKYQKNKLSRDTYLKDFDLENIRYIFFPSQVRAHKNFLNLLKAYKILLRERFANIKLITTADLKSNKEIKNFISLYRLEKDILGMHNVSAKVLAALNARAVCSVNPTLFEGGFPFTFLEAYTVGTPSIMGDIPMTKELIDSSDLQNKMLFDPYSVVDMVDKIEWGVNNTKELFAIQNELYKKLKKRSWADCAADYMQVLEDVSK